MPQAQTQQQVTVQYTLTVRWVKTTPNGAVAPSWTAYFKAERIAILTYLPGRKTGLSWSLHYDGRLAKQVLRLTDNVWIYCPTMALAKQRVAALAARLPN